MRKSVNPGLYASYAPLRRAAKRSDRLPAHVIPDQVIQADHLRLRDARRIGTRGKKHLWLIPGRDHACIYYGARYGGFTTSVTKGDTPEETASDLLFVEQLGSATTVLTALPDGAHKVELRIDGRPPVKLRGKTNAVIKRVAMVPLEGVLRWVDRKNVTHDIALP